MDICADHFFVAPGPSGCSRNLVNSRPPIPFLQTDETATEVISKTAILVFPLTDVWTRKFWSEEKGRSHPLFRAEIGGGGRGSEAWWRWRWIDRATQEWQTDGGVCFLGVLPTPSGLGLGKGSEHFFVMRHMDRFVVLGCPWKTGAIFGTQFLKVLRTFVPGRRLRTSQVLCVVKYEPRSKQQETRGKARIPPFS